MLGVIGFLSTTFLFSPIINFFIFIFVLFRCFHLKMHQIRIEKKQFLAVLIMWVAASLSVLNFWLVEPASSNMEKSILGEFPYLTMLIISLAVSFFAIYEDLKWVFILILVEIFIGLLEYGYGVRSFFVASAGETLVGETDLLYYNRVFGLIYYFYFDTYPDRFDFLLLVLCIHMEKYNLILLVFLAQHRISQYLGFDKR